MKARDIVFGLGRAALPASACIQAFAGPIITVSVDETGDWEHQE
jgi:hypothetical protein